MFQLDDKFLQDVGLGDMPADEKPAFLKHLYQELELRVGTKLSEGMSEDQLGQFEAFVDSTNPQISKEEREKAFNKVMQWFEKYLPNYQDLPDFQSLRQSAPADVSSVVLLSEYGSLKWLEINRPDYKQVVAGELEKLKGEITQDKDAYLA